MSKKKVKIHEAKKKVKQVKRSTPKISYRSPAKKIYVPPLHLGNTTGNTALNKSFALESHLISNKLLTKPLTVRQSLSS